MPRSCQGKKKEEKKNEKKYKKTQKKTRLVPNHGDCGGDPKVLPRQIWQRPREYSDDPVTNPSGIAIWCRSITPQLVAHLDNLCTDHWLFPRLHSGGVSNPTRWSLSFILGLLYRSSRQQRDIMRLCTNLAAFQSYSDLSSYPVDNRPWIAFWDLGNTPSNLTRCPLANLVGICILMNF